MMKYITSGYMYRVTHLVDSNLPLTSKQKFRFGLACPDLARPKQNFCFDVNGRFESTRCVTLYMIPIYLPITPDYGKVIR